VTHYDIANLTLYAFCELNGGKLTTSERLVVEILTIGAIQVRFLSLPFIRKTCKSDTQDDVTRNDLKCH